MSSADAVGAQATPLRHVGGYAVLGELGRGGMAVVYLARQPGLDRLVALKELLPVADPGLARRFLRESRLAGSLAHPNVVIVHDRFEADGRLYIAMEYVPGGSLRPYVGRLSIAQSIAVLEGVLAGLAHAEGHGIVHRDIKPENVMVTLEGGVKIADFGVAESSGQLWSGTLTASGETLGTPAYIAPEQALAEPVGPPTDLYSVGCMAYELFTGRLPFGSADQPMALLLRHVREAPVPAADVAPGVDRRVSDWIAGLLRKDPNARPQRAEDAWRQLEEIAIAIEGARWRRGGRLATPVPAAAIPEAGEIDPRPAEARFVTDVPAPAEPVVDPSDPAPAEAGFVTDDPAPAELVVDASDPAPAAPRVVTDDPAVAARLVRRHPAVAATVTLLGLAAGLVATLPRGPAPGTPPPAPPIEAGKLSLQPPPGWTGLAPALHIPGLELIDAVSLTGRSAGAAVAGIAPRSAHRRALLPDEFERALGTPPTGVEVTLQGNLNALRYDGLRPRGLGRTVTVYAVPTTAGVATVACVDPAGARGTVAAACRSFAGSLRVPGERTFPLGPSHTLGDAIDAELRRLMATLRTSRRGLLGTRRATAASTISAGYRDVFNALDPIATSPADEAVRRPLLAALRAAGQGYRALAAAVRSKDAAGYRAAATRAERGERRVAAAQRRLREDGFRDLIGERFRAAAIPPLPPSVPPVEPYVPPAQTATPTPYPTTAATPTPYPTVEGGECGYGSC